MPVAGCKGNNTLLPLYHGQPQISTWHVKGCPFLIKSAKNNKAKTLEHGELYRFNEVAHIEKTTSEV